jgi:RNA polymerase sigma-70 factor, ECF subfamily
MKGAGGGRLKRDLVEAARRGDSEAFGALVRLEVAGVYRTAMAILGRPADAEEATQDAFVSAWRGLRHLRDADRFDAWFGRIVVNACRMALRRRGRVREIAFDDASVANPAGMASAASRLEGIEEADAFDRAFGGLGVDDRAILTFHYLDGLGVAEIGQRLALREGTVKSRLFRARQNLADRLGREVSA